MNEKDFERIAELFSRIDARFDEMEARFNSKFEEMDTTIKAFKREIIKEFNHSLDIKYEELFHRIGLLRDGVADVVERVEGVNGRFDVLNETVEHNSLQLIAHHLDTHAHNRPSGYHVKEDEAAFGDLDPFHQFDPEFRRRLVESRKNLDEAADEVRAYCAEKGVELPTANAEAMLRLIEESRKHRLAQELKDR